MKQVFNSIKAPEALGPYSQSVQVGNFLYLSGQLGISRETGKLVSDDIQDQARQAFQNIGYILNVAGLTYDDIFKVRVYMTNIEDFSKINEVYGDYFNKPYPVRTALAVKSIPAGGLIELEVVAHMGDK